MRGKGERDGESVGEGERKGKKGKRRVRDRKDERGREKDVYEAKREARTKAFGRETCTRVGAKAIEV